MRTDRHADAQTNIQTYADERFTPALLVGVSKDRTKSKKPPESRPELSSVGGASTLQHQSPGMPSLSTSAQRPSVEDN